MTDDGFRLRVAAKTVFPDRVTFFDSACPALTIHADGTLEIADAAKAAEALLAFWNVGLESRIREAKAELAETAAQIVAQSIGATDPIMALAVASEIRALVGKP